ncbi:hypothetical protein QYO99_30405, partial [Pseudomonas aeruginosa]|nr:hypothetical protein [Pseudomonas aeruginosa]
MTKETLTIVLFSIGSGLIGYAIGIAAAWLGTGSPTVITRCCCRTWSARQVLRMVSEPTNTPIIWSLREAVSACAVPDVMLAR